MRKLIREFQREFPFAIIEITRGGHIRLRLPNGRVVIASSTPSCPFALRNTRADVRRQLRSKPSN